MNKKLKNILIGLITVCVFILFVLLSLLSKRVTPVPAGTVGNTPGNANNGGYFCEYDGIVYFANPYDNHALYAMSPDESHMEKLAASGVSHINAGGNYLFYFQDEASGASGLGYVRSAHGLYRATLKGNKLTCLSKDLIFNLQLIGNSLYYLTSDNTGAKFYKLNTDKSDKTLLAETGYNFACAASDGTVFYNGTETNHYLYKYDTKNDSSSVVWKGNLWYPIYDNDYIYFLDVDADYRLCRYSLNKDIVEVLTHDRVDCYNLAGNYIYYQINDVSSPALMRMTLDGQNVETVAEGNYTHINVTSRYVYFTAYESDIPVYRTPVSGNIYVEKFDAARKAAMGNMKK